MVLLSFGFSWKSNRIYPLRLFFTKPTPNSIFALSKLTYPLFEKKGFKTQMGHIYIRGKMDFDVTLYHAWVIQTQKRLKESHFELLLGTWQSLWSFLKVSGSSPLYELTEKILMKGWLYSKYERCLGSCQLVYGPCHFDRFWYRVL